MRKGGGCARSSADCSRSIRSTRRSPREATLADVERRLPQAGRRALAFYDQNLQKLLRQAGVAVRARSSTGHRDAQPGVRELVQTVGGISRDAHLRRAERRIRDFKYTLKPQPHGRRSRAITLRIDGQTADLYRGRRRQPQTVRVAGRRAARRQLQREVRADRS